MSKALLERALANRDERSARIKQIADAAEARADKALTADEEAEVARLADEKRQIDEQLPTLRDQALADETAEHARRQLQSMTGVAGPFVRVKSEPHTYRRGGQHSYFRDLAKRYAPGEDRDENASERLARHRKEMETLAEAGELEVRANMNTTDGTGGEFVPPLWLMDQYVPLARAGRVFASLCRNLPLPPGTDSVNLPKVATGAAVATQTQGSAVQNTDMTTTSVSGTVITKAGQQRFSMQLLDQSPVNMDEVVFFDLLNALETQIDDYAITQVAGQASIVSVSYTDAAPTVPELYPKIADGIQQIHSNRYLPAQAHVMHPRRWAWHTAALDSSNRPLVVPNAQGPTNAFAGFSDVRAEGSVGTLQGLPVYLDPTIPTTLGGGTEDEIFTCRFDDIYLYEGSTRSRVLFETDADTLQVRVQLWRYATIITGRYPKSIAKITGTGLIAPVF